MRPLGNGGKQCLHLRRGALLSVTVQLVEPCRRSLRQQPAEVGEQVREVHRVSRPGAEIDDAVNRERAAIVRQLPAFQRPQQAADHRRLAHAAAADYRHQSKALVLEEGADQSRLDMPVLEVDRGDHWQPIDEAGVNLAGDGFRRLPLPFETSLDALFRTLLCRLRVLDRLLLLADLPFQLGDLFLDA